MVSPTTWRGRKLKRIGRLCLEVFAEFDSLLSLEPRPRERAPEPMPEPDYKRGIGRHFDAAWMYIGRALEQYKQEQAQQQTEGARDRKEAFRTAETDKQATPR